MREILFKAKRIDNGEWVEGSLLVLDSDSGYCFITEEYKSASTLPARDLIYNHTHFVDSNTVCQYTGLTDKNGNKIWENDIMVAHFDDIYPEDESYTQVIWYQNGFYTKEKMSPDREPLDDFDSQNYTVCGNIFDNAELLNLVREV